MGALKAQDVFAVHGFPVGLLQCEPNLLGILNAQGAPVGSGGWLNIVDKYSRAKQYCVLPCEIQRQGRRNVQYSELMDFCYVGLRGLAPAQTEGFSRLSTQTAQDLTGNVTQGRGLI